MNENLERTCESVAEWLAKTSFSGGFIFGSLVHNDGGQFDCQLSDVDVICRFGADEPYLTRWQTVVAARAPTRELNIHLLSQPGRNDASKPIASIVPVTEFELRFGIHKDNGAAFFSHNPFYCVRSRRTLQLGEEHEPQSARLEGVLNAVREAQRMRNGALAFAPNGDTSLGAYDGPDVLPKSLTRSAAQVRWALQDRPNPEDRFDLNEGFIFTFQLLAARRDEHSTVEDLVKRVSVRMGGRGQAGPLSVADQLLLWEILADEAVGLAEPELGGEQEAVTNPRHLRIGVTKQQKSRALSRAGFKCSFPGCGVPLGEDGIGEVVFINSPYPGGPRHDPNLEPGSAASLQNLLILCPTHHRLVDQSPATYPADTLAQWNHPDSLETKGAAFNAKDLFTVARRLSDLLLGD